MWYLLFFRGNNGYAIVPQCYVTLYIACIFYWLKMVVRRLSICYSAEQNVNNIIWKIWNTFKQICKHRQIQIIVYDGI
jgi:hypothetical protein